jgi:hypothetical protein
MMSERRTDTVLVPGLHHRGQVVYRNYDATPGGLFRCLQSLQQLPRTGCEEGQLFGQAEEIVIVEGGRGKHG